MQERTITVTTTVSEKLPADTVDISITAVSEANKYADAVDGADKTADATVSALKAAGFDDVRALGINVCARHADGKIVGYRAARAFSLSFALDRKRLCSAIDALSGSRCEWHVSFSLKDTSVRTSLVSRAVERSREDAKNIAAAAGAKLGELVNAEYSSSDNAAARPVLFGASYADNEVEPESMTVSETVSCTWSIIK